MSTDDQAPGTAPGHSTGAADGNLTPDEAYERVRDADPAADVTPDLAAIVAKDATVRAHLGEAFGSASADASTGPGAGRGPGRPVGGSPSGGRSDGLDEVAVRRERTRRRVPLVGAVAAGVAGVLAFGAGGFALGSTGSGGAAPLATADAPISLQDFSAGSAEGGAAADSTARSAVGGMSPMPGFGGRTVFTSAGLATEGASAPAWAYDAAGTFSAETAAKVAAALGVAGEPRQEYGAWAVGPADGQGPTVNLQPDGTTSVSFNDPAKDPWACGAVAVPEGADAPGAEQMMVDPQAGCGRPDLGSAPTPEAATAASKEVLASLGLDPAGFEYATESYDDEGTVLAVTAAQVVEGQRTGVAWNLTYSGAGLSALYGSLAPMAAIGEYAVVSPAAAVERLGDPRFANPGMVAYARVDRGPATLDGAVADVAPVEPEVPTVPPTVGEGAAVSWPVDEVTITSARLGWAVHHQADGGAVLVPSYELSDADGSTWSVIAVADDDLDFTSVG